MNSSNSSSVSRKGENLASTKLKVRKLVRPLEKSLPDCLKDLYPVAAVENVNDAFVLILHAYMLEVGFIPKDVPQNEKLQLMPKYCDDSGVYHIVYYHPTCPELSCMMSCVPLGRLLSIFGTTDDIKSFPEITLCLQASHYTKSYELLLDEKCKDPSKIFYHLRKLSQNFKDNFAYQLLAAMQDALGFGPTFGLSVVMDHIKLQILSYLPVQSVAAMSCVNKEFNELCKDSSLWKKLFLRDFSSCTPKEGNQDWKKLYRKRLLLRKVICVSWANHNTLPSRPSYQFGCPDVPLPGTPRNPHTPNFDIGIPLEVRNAFPHLRARSFHQWDSVAECPLDAFNYF